MRTCLPSECILEAADFSKKFQVFLEIYGKQNNSFECAFNQTVNLAMLIKLVRIKGEITFQTMLRGHQ